MSNTMLDPGRTKSTEATTVAIDVTVNGKPDRIEVDPRVTSEAEKLFAGREYTWSARAEKYRLRLIEQWEIADFDFCPAVRRLTCK